MHWWYSGEQDRSWSGGGGVLRNVSICVVDIFLFYGCFLRDATERCGESTRPGLRSQPLHLMSVHVGTLRA